MEVFVLIANHLTNRPIAEKFQSLSTQDARPFISWLQSKVEVNKNLLYNILEKDIANSNTYILKYRYFML